MAIINTKIALRNDSFQNWKENENEVLLKGEIGIEFDESGKVKMKVGDGKTPWSSLPYFGGNADATATQVFQADVQEGEDDLTAIARVTKDITLVEGDMAVVRTTTAEKTFHTAYVYDNGNWAAMDGNYNAENVYFDEDLLTTTAIGNISLSSGQATIPAAGKNLKEVWETIFVKEKNPSKTDPKVSFSSPTQSNAYEVGTVVTPSYTASLSSGSYTYGPATGITATGWTVKLKNGDNLVETLNSASGSFNAVTLKDNDNYTIYAEADHEDGSMPVTNRGNAYAGSQIKAGKKSATCSYSITSYRNSFYGTITEKTAPTSDIIRSLNKSNKALSNGDGFDVEVPVGAIRVIIAYPAYLDDLTAVKDNNDSMSNIISSFIKTTVAVNDASGSNAIDYKVYYIDYANPNDVKNTYSVVI